ncbi:MAG: OsmC family protein [Planctomycetota bacterium]|jgi:putative redox protein
MADVHTLYDAAQHCVALKESRHKTVAMDCPYTGKGEEFSPTNLVEAALGGCMLLAMGTLAKRHDIDLTGARVSVGIAGTDKPVMRFNTVNVEVGMPAGLSARDRTALERAADGCPIKHSLASDIPITIQYKYPD